MPIIPAGSPLWARTVEVTDYGGNTEKSNYMNRSGIDALTDVNAEQFGRLTADAVAVARTSPIAVVSWECRDPGVPLVKYVHTATGVRLVAYDGDEPPIGFPSVTRIADGAVEVTFDSEYTDSYGVVAPFALTQAMVCARRLDDGFGCRQVDGHRDGGGLGVA